MLASVFFQIAAIAAAFVLLGVFWKKLLAVQQCSYAIIEGEKDKVDCRDSSSSQANLKEMAKVESTVREPYVLKLGPHGYIQGVTVVTNDTAISEKRSLVNSLAHYFGNVRYALPPLRRWAMARELPSYYSYGTEKHPGICDGVAATCPQPDSDGAGWDEDCFQCNIWVPIDEGDRPEDGMYRIIDCWKLRDTDYET